MGIAHAKIRLENPKRDDLQPLEVAALADSGPLFLCSPEQARMQLASEMTFIRQVA